MSTSRPWCRSSPTSTRASLYGLLCEIDEDEGYAGDAEGIDAHRWLHATYAVAARDGTPGAHRAYMCALDRVMRLVTGR